MDYKHMRPDDDDISRAELRGIFVGLLYGIAIGVVILAPLWAQLLDQGAR